MLPYGKGNDELLQAISNWIHKGHVALVSIVASRIAKRRSPVVDRLGCTTILPKMEGGCFDEAKLTIFKMGA